MFIRLHSGKVLSERHLRLSIEGSWLSDRGEKIVSNFFFFFLGALLWFYRIFLLIVDRVLKIWKYSTIHIRLHNTWESCARPVLVLQGKQHRARSVLKLIRFGFCNKSSFGREVPVFWCSISGSLHIVLMLLPDLVIFSGTLGLFGITYEVLWIG